MKTTLAVQLDDASARAYDAFVLASPAGHAAQTRAWAEVARAAASVSTYLALVRDGERAVGAALVQRPSVGGLGLPWAWVERGPVVADVGEIGSVTASIARALRMRAVVRMRVMPYLVGDQALLAEEKLRGLGFRDVQSASGPHAATLRLAIGGKTDAELFAGKRREQVRRRIHQAEKAGALARPGVRADWEKLRAMHETLMRAQGKRGRGARWWSALERFVADETRGAIFACDFEGRVVAACVVVRHGELATYAWGASVGDKLPFPKAIPPLVAAIRWARDVGCTTFDLGGIPLEDDRDPKRNAIAMFKLDFDRTRVRLAREHGGWTLGC
jgi:lipid II:glycine glycyltransferase (peptidoglycan interpeptide bridge formation enzyme)